MFKSKRRPIAIPQAEHLKLAGQLASMWGNSEFDLPEISRSSFVAGVGQHDRGYGTLDTLPVGEMSESDWIEISRRSFYMTCPDPVADLVAKYHLRRLASHEQTPARLKLTAEFDEKIREIEPHLGFSTGLFDCIDRITELCDKISFDFCFEVETISSVKIQQRSAAREVDVTYWIEPGRISIRPWPFSLEKSAGAITGYNLAGYPISLDPKILNWELFPR